MTLSRRRFLCITACALGSPATLQAAEWRGRAFGAEVSLSLRGPRAVTEPALNRARALIDEVEGQFSLFDPSSELSRLNRAGRLRPSPRFRALMLAADTAFRLTGGLFDPTVQPLWRALAQGGDLEAARALIGWDRVGISPTRVSLGAGQALTFNGIAQGYATDVVTEALQAAGLTDTLVNIGEFRATGGPWTLGLTDPVQGHMGLRHLSQGAIATSSPAATSVGGQGHILHRRARPRWSTVSVEAANATLADSLSTALVLAPRAQIEAIRALPDVRRITLVDFDGDLTTL